MEISPVISQIPEAMQGNAEQDLRRARASARNRADRSDNGTKEPAVCKSNRFPQAGASRACGFEVSAEPARPNGLFLTESHIPLK
jgi:hypothetical protein